MKKFAAILAVALAGLAGVAEATTTQTTIHSTTPGALGKNLTVRKLDENSVRLTIEGKSGHKESIVVLAGDVRSALYATTGTP